MPTLQKEYTVQATSPASPLRVLYASSMVNQSDVAIYGIEVDGNLTDMTRRRRAPRAS